MSSTTLPSVLIICPALAEANNGNWHTALRWSRMLRAHCRTTIAAQWAGEAHDAMIALHARRSAPSIHRWARERPTLALIVALTGTDLVRDILVDADAQHSLLEASHLIVLQEQGLAQLSHAAQAKCTVIHASARPLRPVPLPRRGLRAIEVGHLREDKDPACFMRAARHLRERDDIAFLHVGRALDNTLAAMARRTEADCPRYRWLGELPRGVARQHVRHAQLLVNSSRMEGGAQVIVEAVQCGTAVIASHIPGNVGLLGADHPGYFEPGRDAELARLIGRARDEPRFLALLRQQTRARAPLFDPAEEQRRLVKLVTDALETPR